MLKIITDSSAEFTRAEAEALGVKIVPLSVIFGNDAYLEGEDLTKDEFYRRLVGGEFPSTSQPSELQFCEAFAETEGEETLAILISSKLSGTFHTAEMAKREGNFTKVHIYDSLCTTAMLRIMVETAVKNREKSAAEVMAILDELRPRIRLIACLDTLEFLYKGGRIRKSIAIVGGMLGIKPLIEISADGYVVMAGKAHGRKKALKALSDRYGKAVLDPDCPVYCLQTNNEEPPREVMAAAKIADAPLLRICCAVGTHIGPDAAGIVYVEKKLTVRRT